MELLNRPLEDYLRHRFGPQAVLEHAVRFPRGSSRLTWFVDRRTAPGGPIRPLAFRGDFAGGATIHSSLEQEYFIYERLGNTAVAGSAGPVVGRRSRVGTPPLLCPRADRGMLGGPAFQGSRSALDALQIDTSREHLRKLAIVHTVDCAKDGFDERLQPPPDVEQCTGHFLDAVVARFEEYRRESFPIVIEALGQLRRGVPVAPCISLCKGMNGLGEEVFRDGVIVAMSNWEGQYWRFRRGLRLATGPNSRNRA